MNLESLKTVIVPIHREGWFFIAIGCVVTFLLMLLSTFLGCVGAVITAWMAYFFRDPKRVTPIREGLIISPADGLVSLIKNVVPPKELGLGKEECVRVSVFLNIFDVHINRIPADGTIIKSHYHAGTFVNASLDKASDHNERHMLTLETKNKTKIGFVQIAGLIARRIRCDVSEGQQVLAGQQYGLIRFGSRCDVFLPKGSNVLVIVGQRVLGGESVISDLSSKEPSRIGEIR